MTEENHEGMENIEIVSVEEKNPFADLIKSIANSVTPIVAETVKAYAETNPGEVGPTTGDRCVHCGDIVEGAYSELNIPLNSKRLCFDRYSLCEKCTKKILEQL